MNLIVKFSHALMFCCLSSSLLVSVSAHAIDFIGYSVPSYEQVRSDWQSSDVKFLAANGELIQRIRTNFNARRGDWLELSQISPALQKAVITSEDKRFYQHGGVDWLATAAAAWSGATGGPVRGASTITMQLAAMLEPAVQRQSGGRTISSKLDQMQLAQLIENSWTKEQILESYLNLANFRGELTGIDVLARVLFQKHASSLNLRESALTAVLLRGPNAKDFVLIQRSCALLKDNLARPDLCKDLDFFIYAVLGRAQQEGFFDDNLAPHLARLYLDNSDSDVAYINNNPIVNNADFNAIKDHAFHSGNGLYKVNKFAAQIDNHKRNIIKTDIDYALQKHINHLIRQHLLDLKSTGITDAAAVVLDNESGKILAYVGSSGDLSQAKQVDHARALRQAGSTLKPFLYAMAIDRQYITAASLLNDAPLDLDVGGGLYIPDNYDHVFTGWVSARTALASSLNIPTVRVLTMVGIDEFGRLLKQLGLPLKHGGDYYGYSLALGSADVDLLSLTNAYRTLARGGDYQAITYNSGIGANSHKNTEFRHKNIYVDQKKAGFNRNSTRISQKRLAVEPNSATTENENTNLFSKSAAWIIGDILSDRQARARTFGLDSSLSTPYWTAVKTGTSRDMRDNWTLGWSDRYTVGVWVGNSAGASMRNVSGVTGAGPIWRDVFSYLNKRSRSVQSEPPSGVEKLEIKFTDLTEPNRTEYFLADTGANQIIMGLSESNQAHIAEPVDGTILALDPEIPFDKQQMQLLASDIYGRPVNGLKWFINGKHFINGAKAWWSPKPGTYVFELRDDFDKVIDKAKVKVQAIKSIKADFHSRSNE